MGRASQYYENLSVFAPNTDVVRRIQDLKTEVRGGSSGLAPNFFFAYFGQFRELFKIFGAKRRICDWNVQCKLDKNSENTK